MGAATKIVVPGVPRLPAFCHAVIAGDFIYVSGMLGAGPNSMNLVEGGIGPETRQTLRNIETILAACDATLDDLVKANVYLDDMADFRRHERSLGSMSSVTTPPAPYHGRAGRAGPRCIRGDRLDRLQTCDLIHHGREAPKPLGP